MPLDEAIASRAVFVIVSGSDGRTGGRKRFWSQLNNSKTVIDRSYVSIGSEYMSELLNEFIPIPTCPKQKSRKSATTD